MTLRRKLLIAFGGLAALALLAAAVTVYLTAQWQGATEEMRAHYTRSLLLQSVRAETFQALAEVNDALAGQPEDYADARGDFERAIAETGENFAEWQSLAGDLSETTEIMEVRASYERLTDYARQVFDLLDAGRREEAVRLVDDELDTGDYAQFQEVTELAVAADARIREGVTAASEDLRITALVMTAVIAIFALSLTLLIAAYLAQDLFQPLSQLRTGLERLADGQKPDRLNFDREDEFGSVALAFNRASAAFERREEPSARAAEDGTGEPATPGEMLLAALARIRSGLHALRKGAGDGSQDQILSEVEGDTETVMRALSLGFPTRLQLSPVDPRETAREALMAISVLLVERGVSCECEFEPTRTSILADRPRLREILCDLLRDALAALPPTGGRIGLRVRREPELATLCIDIATSGGAGAAEEDRSADRQEARAENAHTLVRRRFVTEHRGRIEINRGPDGASVTRLMFPVFG